jgi:hypothetical protein
MTDSRATPLVTATAAAVAALAVVWTLRGRSVSQGQAHASMERARRATRGRSEGHADGAAQARLLTLHPRVGGALATVEVRNDSEASFTDLEVRAAHLLMSDVPDGYTSDITAGRTLASLEPRGIHTVVATFRDATGAAVEPHGMQPSLEVAYTDAHGVRWSRLAGAPPRRDP